MSHTRGPGFTLDYYSPAPNGVPCPYALAHNGDGLASCENDTGHNCVMTCGAGVGVGGRLVIRTNRCGYGTRTKKSNSTLTTSTIDANGYLFAVTIQLGLCARKHIHLAASKRKRSSLWRHVAQLYSAHARCAYESSRIDRQASLQPMYAAT
eukprot:scaffold18279_cov35-Tisochrysis_lutea.AAC.1